MECRLLDQLVLWGFFCRCEKTSEVENGRAVRREGPRRLRRRTDAPTPSTQTNPGGLPRRRQICPLGILDLGSKLVSFRISCLFWSTVYSLFFSTHLDTCREGIQLTCHGFRQLTKPKTVLGVLVSWTCPPTLIAVLYSLSAEGLSQLYMWTACKVLNWVMEFRHKIEQGGMSHPHCVLVPL